LRNEIENAHNLTTSLESFTKAENLENKEIKFTCDKCNQNVSVEKQLMLDLSPPVCAFYLKRFKNDGAIVEKIDKHVEFPPELDLLPYTCGNQVSNVIKVSEKEVLFEKAYILFYTKHVTPSFSNFMKTYKPSIDSTLSNTSPKSVLENVDHHSTSPSYNNNFPYSFDRLIYNKTKAAKSKFPPLATSNSFGVTSPISHKVGCPSWEVRLGRIGSTGSITSQAMADLPRGNNNPFELIASFDRKRLSLRNMDPSVSLNHRCRIGSICGMQSSIKRNSNPAKVSRPCDLESPFVTDYALNKIVGEARAGN
ncbi:ubiquitin carboxyl-terminal hydrolase 20-like protein, partial [Tanacetum coccineum]